MNEPTPAQLRAQEKFGASVGHFGAGVIGKDRYEAEQAAIKQLEEIGPFGPGVTGRAAEVLEPAAVELVLERLRHQHQDDPRSRVVNEFGPAVGGAPTAPAGDQSPSTPSAGGQPSQPLSSARDESTPSTKDPERLPVFRTGGVGKK